jgi:hypothetical protein
MSIKRAKKSQPRRRRKRRTRTRTIILRSTEEDAVDHDIDVAAQKRKQMGEDDEWEYDAMLRRGIVRAIADLGFKLQSRCH